MVAASLFRPHLSNRLLLKRHQTHAAIHLFVDKYCRRERAIVPGVKQGHGICVLAPSVPLTWITRTNMLSTLRFVWRCLSLRRAGSLDPRRLAEIQMARLRQLVRTATERAPFFRDRYRGIDLDHLKLEQLPTVTKANLMEHLDNAVTDPAVRREDLEHFIAEPDNRTKLFRNRYVVCHTSGSQGQPLILIQEPWNIDLLFALQAARGSAFAQSTVAEVLRRLVEPVRLATVGLQPGFYPSSAAWAHYPAGARSLVKVKPFLADDPNMATALREYQPHVLIAYASQLDSLAVQASELKLAPTLRQVVNSSETLAKRARHRLEQAFGVPVLDTYATGECMFLSQGCPAGPGAHVNADWAILEVVDADNQPVPPGVLGKKVLITNLANTLQPIIRYEIGDLAKWDDQPCACGSRLPKIAEVQGRSTDTFWVGENGTARQITAFLFKNAADHMHHVREWQAVQEERNRIHVRLLPLPGAKLNPSQAREKYIGHLRHGGLPSFVKVDVAVVRELTPDPKTRKLKRIISKVGPPERQSKDGHQASLPI